MTTVSFSDYRQDFPIHNIPIIDIAGNDVSDIVNNIIYDKILDIKEDDPTKCSVCGKDFKHTIVKKVDGDYELDEVEIRTTHKKCEKLMKRITKLKNDLLNCEFILYCLRN